MASPERKISVVPPPGGEQPSGVDARLASLQDEATRLRAEIAALQDDMRWLTGNDEPEAGWLERGWVRASLLLTTVGVVAVVSVPYFGHLLDAAAPDSDPAPAAAVRSAPVSAPAAVAPARARAAAREQQIPAPVRSRAPESPAPARVLPADDQPGTAPRPRVIRERPAITPDAVPTVGLPIRGESP